MIQASRTDRLGAESLEGAEGEKSLEVLEGEEALVLVSGERVRNTWVIYPEVGNN